MYYKLQSNCIVVNGAKRCAIYDLQRGDLYLITKNLFDLFNSGIFKIDGIKLEIIEEEIIKELIENDVFLMLNRLEEYDLFPEISKVWDNPSKISNALIFYGKNKLTHILPHLEKIGCRDIQIVFENEITLENLENILEGFSASTVKNIQLVIPFFDFNLDKLKSIIKAHLRIKLVFIYNSRKNQTNFDPNRTGNIVFSTKKLVTDCLTSKISPKYLLPNIQLYTESLIGNTYYNQKLIINSEGLIVRYIGDNINFGNIFDMDYAELESVISSSEYKFYWTVKKDDILVCKECEFRYCCVDNRLPLKDGVFWTFSKNCNYNPYTLKWKKH